MGRKNQDFRDTLAGFRGSLKDAGAESLNPGLQMILERGRASRLTVQLRWAAAVAVIATVVVIPLYQHQREAKRVRQELAERQRQAAEDALLLQQINDSLSRQVPRAMAVLMGGN